MNRASALQPAAPIVAAENSSPSGLSPEEAKHFEAIARFAHEAAGLVLKSDKAPMVFARIGKRMRKLQLPSLADYRRLIESEAGSEERRELIFVLTTNVTSFMRERHHFELLRDEILPSCIERARSKERVRFWSAGCSTGQEPYSLAMVLLELFPDAPRYDLRILATDIDPHVLSAARAGHFTQQQAEQVSVEYRERFFTPGNEDPKGVRAVSQDARDLITFKELNLLSEWPMKGPFDVILCRNVVIYFDRATQTRLWDRFHNALRPGGHLILGHSERLDTNQNPAFRSVGTTVYQRDGSGVPRRERI